MTAGFRRLRPADDLISPVVAEALSNLPDLTPADTAARHLAGRYAAAIDQASGVDVDRIGDALDPDDMTGRQMLARLARQVEAQAVLGELGPKLLAVLEALGATPRARAVRKGGVGNGSSLPGKLAAIRDSRSA